MASKFLTQLKSNVSDSMVLLSCANQSILQTRKDEVVQQIRKKYKSRIYIPKDTKKTFHMNN